MEIDADRLIKEALFDGVREGLKSKMTGYSRPIDKLLGNALSRHGDKLQAIIDEAIVSISADPEWRDQIRKTARETMAKILVQRIGGEIEKQVNVLKSNPITRAKITTAIDDIIKASV